MGLGTSSGEKSIPAQGDLETTILGHSTVLNHNCTEEAGVISVSFHLARLSRPPSRESIAHIFTERVFMFKGKMEDRHLQFFKETEFLVAIR